MPYIQTEMWTRPVPTAELLEHLEEVRQRDDVRAVEHRGSVLDELYANGAEPDMCLVMQALGLYGQSG